MPFLRSLARAPSAAASALGRLTRALAWAAVLALTLFAVLLLVVRLVVFPSIDRYRDTITAALGARLHQHVDMDSLGTGWEGWNPKLVISGLRMRPGIDAPPALELPRVELTVAWTSLPLLDIRLKTLVVDRPKMAIRRDEAGALHVAGIDVDGPDLGDDSAMTAWLLRQREIVVRDASITWIDERRHAPKLALDKVNFRLENRFGRNRFGFIGSPPAEIASPIELRGDLAAGSFRDWEHVDGQIYARLDYLDLAASRTWLPLPVGISRGKGALRAWLTLARGQPREIVADVELIDVRARLEPQLPELALVHVGGRTGWRFASTGREIFWRELGFTTASGLEFPPANLSLRFHPGAEGPWRDGRLQFDRIELAPLRDLVAHLPLPERWRAEVGQLQPQGTLSRGSVRWRGAVDAPTSYDVSAELAHVGIAAHDAWPGAANLSGTLQASTEGGQLRLDARRASLLLPRYFNEPVVLDSLQGALTWTTGARPLTVRIDDAAFANADFAGSLHAVYRPLAAGPGHVDLEASLTRARAAALPAYLPKLLSAPLRDWLARAIQPGTIDAARLRLEGDLARFPFVDGEGGVFSVAVKGRDFGLDYASRWPALAGIDGDIEFQGPGMHIAATHGVLYGVTIGKATAIIADLRDPVLRVEGEASGPTADFLRFIEASPVGGWTGRFTEGAQAEGDGHLALELALPLRDLPSSRVSGDYTFLDDRLALAGVPTLGAVRGKLAFTKGELSGRDITAEALGGPVRIAIGTSDGRVRIAASGTADLRAVRQAFDFPLASQVSGSADWSFNLDKRGDATSWVVESSLRGVAIDLPPPLAKAAPDALPMRIERPPARGAHEDMLVGDFGEVAHFSAHRRIDGAAARLDRAVIALGRAPREPDAGAVDPGLWLRADLPAVDVDAWLDLERRPATATGRSGVEALELAGVDIQAGRLSALGHAFTGVKVDGSRARDHWRLRLSGQEIAGSATWDPPHDDAPNGRVTARLAHLTLPPRDDANGGPASGGGGNAVHWPELDITADAFFSRGRDLGRLELTAQPRSGEWRIDRLLLANDSGRIEASGAWKAGARPDQTRLDISVDALDGGGLLAHFGHPGAVQGAPTLITGQLAWAGDPSAFDYPSLSGALHVEVGAGRFMKIEPGIGKLLGVLSLQALPRRVTLDFRDVFSEGFTFDRVTGNVRIAQGVMRSDDLRLAGPSAQVAIAGEADLARETQSLRVRVQPTLSAGVSAGAALLFLANPLVGAAVGAGSLLAQKVLRDPIEQMFSYEYAVVGSWSDPKVTRGTTATAAAPPESTVK